VNYCCC